MLVAQNGLGRDLRAPSSKIVRDNMPPDVPSLCLLIHTDVTMAVPFNSSCLWLCIPEIVDDPSFFFELKVSLYLASTAPRQLCHCCQYLEL